MVIILSSLLHPVLSAHLLTPSQVLLTLNLFYHPGLEFKPAFVFIIASNLGALHSKTHSKRVVGFCEHLLSLLFLVWIIIIFYFFLNLWCRLNFIVSMYTYKKIMGIEGSLREGRVVLWSEKTQVLTLLGLQPRIPSLIFMEA